MTKKEMAQAIADDMGLRQSQVLEIVQRVFDSITDALVREGRIELRNFGVFEVKTRKPRKGRNPRTGESVQVPARRVVTFKPGREMEEQVRRPEHPPAEVTAVSTRSLPLDRRETGG